MGATRERVSMDRMVPAVTPPTYHRALLDAELLSESVREFREAVLHVGNRLPLEGRRDMLSEKRTNPLTYMVKLLVAGRRAGLRRGWALRLIAVQRLMVERLWADDRTSIHELELREQAAENRANLLRDQRRFDRSPATYEKWIAAELDHAAAHQDMLCAHKAIPQAWEH